MNYGTLKEAFLSKSRSVQFIYLNGFKRPARKLPEHDLIKASESKADQIISASFRSVLHKLGLSSSQIPTRFGMMHCYDSNPNSTQPALVMLHGIGSSGQCFSWLALMLKERRRVILPDLFHFCGFSTPNNGVMTVEEHAQSVIDLCNNLGLEEFDFCGLSLGGWIGLKLAITEPRRVKSLTLLNSAGLDYRSHALRDTLSHLTWKKFQILYPGLMRAFPYTGASALSGVFGRSLYRLLKQDSVRNFLKTIHSNDFLDKEIGKIKCPSRVLWGHEDRLLSEEVAYDLCARISNCDGYFIERCAHVLCLEAPLNVFNHLNEMLGTKGQPLNTFSRLLFQTAKSFPESKINKERKS
jgi:abhydrolase domain-containing protein 6